MFPNTLPPAMPERALTLHLSLNATRRVSFTFLSFLVRGNKCMKET